MDRRIDRFSDADGALEVEMQDSTFPLTTSTAASGDSPLGRGVHGAIPLHLLFEANDLVLSGKAHRWRLALRVTKKN